MFKFITPTILIGIAITMFFSFTNPYYNEISLAREKIVSYNDALNNSKTLEAERDKLTQKFNSFKVDDLSKLQKLLPDNIDNIRLILEIEKIAAPYSMVLKDIKYDTTNKEVQTENAKGFNTEIKDTSPLGYRILNLEFSSQGTYNNFISFIKDLENNLRIVDISSVEFSSSSTASFNEGVNLSLSEIYKYNFKIKTYWLKN
ncbi:MAG: hypothetical protein UR25_C0003G0032 [Candidatus Nomurabacteria bacterium GW2011_GWE1_32_28]|uniref:Pilus assembly protein, PilO n=1 Tax=Candidatus Nomurabacteria bacterium GW2011_GWF1_31_48 TaxID=1618767 RepID=A0A0F9YF08_9BACT|nr:MAG: hypothetical protein UR10_C0003G0032 [Candidatus Nomurabacteria bacterium GW2011_GWF2_30_133]KKP28672.1 MAG: hypothetical protein UR18_C0002G0084 [Candidatus Nomurabacteria bacterium GW2011_GWE2_31_40]KKP30249.1 MAG: hypothetical protein UR19_C0003G0085 [Candidatus Nomurabacteria bacterium GW2011_GWF1_31_48]KKP34776.1 MAG: hypothetical protein UR25_C0003G0032 [Candidatus Nomurabacteria bacterium GW2011_GWE1_32_28]HAS80766.1 hypothetical protein [Candidatus Nomurabacteria bacterium]